MLEDELRHMPLGKPSIWGFGSFPNIVHVGSFRIWGFKFEVGQKKGALL
jgi:hypothetical protein